VNKMKDYDIIKEINEKLKCEFDFKKIAKKIDVNQYVNRKIDKAYFIKVLFKYLVVAAIVIIITLLMLLK